MQEMALDEIVILLSTKVGFKQVYKYPKKVHLMGLGIILERISAGLGAMFIHLHLVNV